MNSKRITLGFSVLGAACFVFASASKASAQGGGVGIIPIPIHVCKFCYPNRPNICDTTICFTQNANGDAYCGCSGTYGDTDGGLRWARAICLYDPDCIE